MKNSIIFLGVCCILIATACKDQNKAQDPLAVADTELKIFSEEAELEAIMAVIDKETNCFFKRDYDCWQAQWAEREYIALTWNNDDGTYDTNIGADVATFTKKFLEEHPLPDGKSSRHPEIIREGLQAKFYGTDVAYLLWKQYNSNIEGTEFTTSQDFRVMEKIDGVWKIVNVSSFWDYLNPIPKEQLQP